MVRDSERFTGLPGTQPGGHVAARSPEEIVSHTSPGEPTARSWV